MNAFPELFDHLVVKGGKIIRVTAGGETLIHYHFLVDPIGTCIYQVCFYGIK